MITLILDPRTPDMGVLTSASPQTLAELLPATPIGNDAVVRRLHADGGNGQIVPTSSASDAVVTYTDGGMWLYARADDGVEQTLLVGRTGRDAPPQPRQTADERDTDEPGNGDALRRRLTQEATKAAAAAQHAGLKVIDTPQVRERVDALFGAGSARVAVAAVRHAPVEKIVGRLMQSAPELDDLAASINELLRKR